MIQNETNNRKIYKYEDITKSKKIFYILINIIFFLIIVFTVDLISGRKLGVIKLIQIITLGSDEVDWRLAKESYNVNNLNPLEKYISIHPTGKYIKTAKELLESLVWNKTVSINSLEAYKKYVEKFPNGKNYSTAVDEIDWFKTKALNSFSDYSQYIQKHPTGKYVGIASEEIGWANTIETNTLDAFYWFCAEHPEGKYFSSAKDSIWNKTKLTTPVYYYNQFAQKFPGDYRTKDAKEIIDAFVWANAQNANSISSYRQYINDFPDGHYKNEATERIENILWGEVQRENTSESYGTYITEFPNGSYIVEAQNRFTSKRKLEQQWSDLADNIIRGKGFEVYNKPYPTESFNGTFSILTRNKSTIDGTFSYSRKFQPRTLRADLCDLVITCSISGYNERIEFHGKFKDKPCSLRKRCGPVVFELNECDRPTIFRILQYDWP